MLIALGLSATILRQGIATDLVESDASMASALEPGNARIATAAARAAVAAGADIRTAAVRKLVDRALARDVTIPAAIELRAVEARADGDNVRERRLFELSGAISHRSLPTRLWLIQRSVDRGDVAGALEDFDIALRTSTAAPDMLFPVLSRAADDPTLTKPIARVLDRREDWRIPFLHYAISNSSSATGISDVVLDMRDRRAITESAIDQLLIGKLVDTKAFATARRVYDVFEPAGANPSLVRDADFSDPAIRFPFGWDLVERGEAGAERGAIGGKAALNYRSLSGGRGQVATQLLTLSPGRYRLQTRTAAGSGDRAASPYWTLTCGEDGGPQLALLDQPTDAGAQAGVDFTVPPACAGQWVAFNLRPSEAPESSGSIAWVEVTPGQAATR